MSDFLWYLATPYYDANSTIMHVRYIMSTKAAAVLTEQGVMLFPPITVGHQLVERLPSLEDWDQEKWRAWSATFMPRCDGLLIHMQDGWGVSKGLSDELQYFLDVRQPIAYLGADFWSDQVELNRTLLRIEYAKEHGYDDE